MIIELYGPPASGKTTLARSLAAQGAVLVRVRSRAALLWYNLRFFLRMPLRFIGSLWWVLRSGAGGTLRYYKLMNLLQYNARWERARAVPGVAVLDQGHRQNLITFFDYSLSEPELRQFTKTFPPVDQLIVLDVPQGARRGRLSTRGYVDVREALPEAQRRAWIAAYEENHRHFLAALREECRILVRSESDRQRLIDTLV